MNNIKEHVTSLELSKQLDKVGFKIESTFKWVVDSRNEKPYLTDYPQQEGKRKDFSIKVYNTYLATELLGEMPHIILTKTDHYDLNIIPCKNENLISYIRLANGKYKEHPKIFPILAKTLQDAFAEMIIFLKNNGYMEVK